MKTKIFMGLLGALVIASGCVSTVDQRTTAGVPFLKDRIEARYQRTVDQVFQAARDVVKDMGTLVTESTLYNQTNTVRTVEGKVNQRNVWVRIESVDPSVTAVIVQARTQAGGTDIVLAAEIDKNVALKLAAGR